ncbi:MAG: hypothetical protein ACFFDF_02365 [Candidatus Odinarchaeota archaeon]
MNSDKNFKSKIEVKLGLLKFLETFNIRSMTGSRTQIQDQEEYIKILKLKPDIAHQVSEILQNDKELRDKVIKKYIGNFNYKGMRNVQFYLIELILKTINEEERKYLLNELYSTFKKDVLPGYHPPLEVYYERDLSRLIEQVQPNDDLLKILSSCILDCFAKSDPEFYRIYFFGDISVFVMLYVPLYLPILHSLYIKNSHQFEIDKILLHLIQFFKLLWILIKIVPIQVEACIRAHISKYEGEYDDYWDSCLDFIQNNKIYIQKHEIVTECKVYFENLGFTNYILKEDLEDWFGEYVDSIIYKEKP